MYGRECVCVCAEVLPRLKKKEEKEKAKREYRPFKDFPWPGSLWLKGKKVNLSRWSLAPRR
jgi:hypothetical protein